MELLLDPDETPDEIKKKIEEIMQNVKTTLDHLEKYFPGLSVGIGAALGASSGVVGSLAALYCLGTAGFSAAGITSGLAAAGAVASGGMLAGIFVIAAPVAVLGALGYSYANKKAKRSALNTAIDKMFNFRQALMQYPEYAQGQIKELNIVLDVLIARRS
jgi:hypothetical protein